jgi:NTE family protein
MTAALVLSGGASLAAVQVGMLQALAEHGVRPDFVIGTSAGAINGAWVAGHPGMGQLDELESIWAALHTRDIFPLRPSAGVRAVLGRSPAIISDGPLRALIARNLTFSDLASAPLPIYVVATDVLTGSEVLLSRGDAVEAITASAALPGIFAPVQLDGRYLMDGGIANNAPISHAVDLGADTIYVLPAGHSCALEAPPRHALAMVLHAASLLVHQRLAQDVRRYAGRVDLRVAPAVCPLDISPADFSHSRELIRRARVASTRWLRTAVPFDRLESGPDLHDCCAGDARAFVSTRR